MKRGFTLVELMVVIAIIGILASIISVSLVASKARGRDAKRVSDIRTIQLALETYYNDNSQYPLSIYSSPFTPNYLTTVPTDPNNPGAVAGDYLYASYNAGGTTNCASQPIVRYHLAAIMESSDQSGAALPYNPALKMDNDWSAGAASQCSGISPSFPNFNNGNATACSGAGAGSSDNCYDVTN